LLQRSMSAMPSMSGILMSVMSRSAGMRSMSRTASAPLDAVRISRAPAPEGSCSSMAFIPSRIISMSSATMTFSILPPPKLSAVVGQDHIRPYPARLSALQPQPRALAVGHHEPLVHVHDAYAVALLPERLDTASVEG